MTLVGQSDEPQSGDATSGVTITVAELASALRVGTSEEETAEITRLLAYATSEIERIAPGAPTVAKNESAVRLVGYLYDQPTASRGASMANAYRNSGAGRMLAPYRQHKAGTTGTATGAAASAPGGGVSEALVRAIIAEVLAEQPDEGLDEDAVDERIAPWARAHSPSGTIPDNRVPASIARDSEVSSAVADKLTQPQVDARVEAKVSDWAEAGNTDPIPADKLQNAGGAVTDQTARDAAESNLARIHDLQEITRDLHLNGLPAWTKSADPTVIAFAFVGLADPVAVINGDATLDLDTATFDGSPIAFEDALENEALDHLIDPSDSNLGVELLIRLAASEERGDWRYEIRAEANDEDAGTVVPAGHWHPITPDNGDAGYVYFIGGARSAGKELAGFKSTHQVIFDGDLGDGASLIRAELADVRDRTRDLHNDGAVRIARNTSTNRGAVANVGILIADLPAIENGTKTLDVQNVSFGLAITPARFGSTAAREQRPVIRINNAETLGDWRIIFENEPGTGDVAAFLAGGWVEIQVSNGSSGHRYFISGAANAKTAYLELYEHETTYHGTLAAGIVDLDALAGAVAARLLPSGGANGQFLGRAAGRAAWQAAPEGGIGHWYEMAQLLRLSSSPLASGTTYNMELRSDGKARFANAAAVKAALADGTISMLVLQRSTDDETVLQPIAPNFSSSTSARFYFQDATGSQWAQVGFTDANITLVTNFASSSVIRFDLGVYA